MLNESEIDRLWRKMLAAETRSFYFGDLAVRYTRRKQWITGVSFFLSSGAAATLIAKAPGWIAITMALVVAVVNAYSMAVGLDRKIAALVKLHSAWGEIYAGYDRLWSHTYTDEAENELQKIIEREKEPSELATTEAPYDEKLLEKWQDRVFKLHDLTGQHA